MCSSVDGDGAWVAGSGMCSSGDGDGVWVAGSGDGDGVWVAGDGDLGWRDGPEMCSSVDDVDGLIFLSGIYTRADGIGVERVGPEMSSTARGDGEGAACPGESSLTGDGG